MKIKQLVVASLYIKFILCENIPQNFVQETE